MGKRKESLEDSKMEEELTSREVITDHLIDYLQSSHLLRLKDLFDKFSRNQSGRVGTTVFLRAFRLVLPEISSNAALRLFHQVDVGSGDITWSDLVLFIRGFKESKVISDYYAANEERCFDTPADHVIQCVPTLDKVMGIQQYPSTSGWSSDRVAGCYLLASRQGNLMWMSNDFKLVEKRNVRLDVNQIDAPKIPMCAISSMAFLAKRQMIAIATFQRAVNFYDSDPNNFQILVIIHGFPRALADIYYEEATERRPNDMLICAERKAAYSIIWLEMAFFESLRGEGTTYIKRPPLIKKLDYAFLAKKRYPYVSVSRVELQERGLIEKVRYLSSLNSIVSYSSYPGKSNMTVYNLARKSFNVLKDTCDIYCFDFMDPRGSPVICLITGGDDCLIKIWHAWNFNKPCFSLDGRSGPVTHVIADSDLLLIMAMTKNWNIQVWDFETKICRQVIDVLETALDLIYPNLMHYDRARCRLFVISCNGLVFEKFIKKPQLTHKGSVTALLYDPPFNMIITTGQESRVTFWDLRTGRKKAEIFPALSMSDVEEEILCPVLDMSLDSSGKILGAVFGNEVLKIWNVQTTSCLVRITLAIKNTTCVMLTSYPYVIIGGSTNGFIQVHYDRDVYCGMSNYHTFLENHDIQCFASYRRNFFVSAATDNRMILWMLSRPQWVLFDDGTSYRQYVKWFSKEDIKLISEIEEARAPNISRTPIEPGMKTVSQLVRDRRKRERLTSETGSYLLKNGQDVTYYSDLLQDGFSEEEIADMLCDLKKHMGEESFDAEVNVKFHPGSITKLLFLQYRELSVDIATLVSSGKDGFMRFWSLGSQSGLLARFQLQDGKHGNIISLATDRKNKYLITGSDDGYICVLQIEDYLNGKNAKRTSDLLPEHLKLFPYLRLRTSMKERNYDIEPQYSTEEWYDPFLILNVGPVILNSFRAHTKSVISLAYVDSQKIIISGGQGGEARLWHLRGYYIGRVGQRLPFQVVLSGLSFHGEKTAIPSDIREVSSPTTLKVLNKGRCPLWERAMIVLKLNKLKDQLIGVDDVAENEKEKEKETEKEAGSDDIVEKNEPGSGGSGKMALQENVKKEIDVNQVSLGEYLKSTGRQQQSVMQQKSSLQSSGFYYATLDVGNVDKVDLSSLLKLKTIILSNTGQGEREKEKKSEEKRKSVAYVSPLVPTKSRIDTRIKKQPKKSVRPSVDLEKKRTLPSISTTPYDYRVATGKDLFGIKTPARKEDRMTDLQLDLEKFYKSTDNYSKEMEEAADFEIKLYDYQYAKVSTLDQDDQFDEFLQDMGLEHFQGTYEKCLKYVKK